MMMEGEMVESLRRRRIKRSIMEALLIAGIVLLLLGSVLSWLIFSNV